MGGGGQSSQTQSSGQSHEVKQIQLPAWVEAAGKENYERAQGIANQPYEGYEGTIVPEFTGLTVGMLEEIVRQSGMFNNYFDTAGNYLAGVMRNGDVNWQNQAAAFPTGVGYKGIDKYMSPYIQNVEDRAIANMERSGQQAQRGIDADATARRAFGGSRQAIQKAVQGAETTRGIGDLSANLREKAFESGRAAQFRNAELNAAAQRADLERQFSNQDFYREYADSLLKTGESGKGITDKDYFNVLSAGRQYEDKTREGLEEEYKKWSEEKEYPIKMLNLLLASLGMTPYGRTETTDKTESGMSSTKSSGGMDYGSLLSGGAGLLTALPELAPLLGASDRDLKTNIEKLGHDDKLDLPVYAYDYKADVKGKKTAGPKRVGYMAQDVEKKYPRAVKKISGKRVIDFTQLASAA